MASTNGDTNWNAMNETTSVTWSPNRRRRRGLVASRRKRNTVGALALLATTTTTLWWWQTVVLLQFLPPMVLVGATQGGGGIIPPPPPPRPPKIEPTTNARAETLPKKPPPPPRTVSEASSSGKADQSQATPKNTEDLDAKSKPPPPPPARIATEVDEEDYESKQGTEDENNAIVTRSDNPVGDGKERDNGETKEWHQQQRVVNDNHKSQLLTDRQQQQQHFQRQFRDQHPPQHPNSLHNNRYKSTPGPRSYPQRQQQHQQPITRRQIPHGRGPPQRPVRASSSPGTVPASSSALASTLKGLWGRVEKGLDDLAGLEDSVTGTAQRLVTTAVSTASTASKISPSALRSLAQSGAAAAASGAKTASTLRRPRKRIAPSIADATSVPLKPYGNKYEVARETREREQRQKEQVLQPASSNNNKKSISDLLHLGDDRRKIIASKGGAASSPYDQTPNPPGSSGDNGNGNGAPDAPPSGETGPETTTNANPSNVFGASRPPSRDSSAQMEWERRAGPYPPENEKAGNGSGTRTPIGNREPGGGGTGTDHLYTRDPAGPQHRTQPKSRDNHSRSSRIPWDTSPSSPRRQVSSPQRNRRPDRPAFDNRYEERDTPSWKRKLEGIVPSIPPLPNFGKLIPTIHRRRSNSYLYPSLDAWDSTDEEEGGSGGGGIFGFFRRSRALPDSSPPSHWRNEKPDKNDRQPGLVASMLSRCDNGKSASLLNDSDVRASKTIGRYKAILDVFFVVSIILGFKLLSGFDDLVSLPPTWQEGFGSTLPKVGSVLNELADGSWALFAFVYAALFRYARERLTGRRIKDLASAVASSVKEESEYAQLYLRLSAAIPMDRQLPDRLAAISKTQVSSLVAKARLNSYVGIVLASLTVMTVSAVGPILMAFVSTFGQIAMLEEWRQWPFPWEGLWYAVGNLIKNLFHTLESQGTLSLRSFIDNPIQFSFHLTMFASLLVCTLLPQLEERRAVAVKTSGTEDPDEDEAGLSNFDSAEEWSRLGTSSASRLSMLSENGSVENVLARWRASHVTPLDESLAYGTALSMVFRLVGYALIAALVAGSPLVVSHFLAGETPSLSNALSIFRWDSLFDLSFLQVFLCGLVYQTIQKVMESGNDVSVVKNFQAELVSTKKEMDESNRKNSDFQVMGSVSPSAGMAVRDLWAAHATKRAWAVRGANLQCKNGEILAIVGDDGNGKTRLLTTLAEALTFPPKRTATTNKVRGLISIGGLELSKWNRKMLKRRLGIFLSDVRMIADSASLFSGWTMEEILEPVDGLRSSNNDPLQRTTYTSAEKSAMLLALKITGLYNTLLARLPSKTLTIFTSNEEDLRPTSLKPRSALLSPGEWSKLVLARVLAQTIYDNDNALASNNKIENSLVGSILLLDEPTTMHSEVDEGQLFRDLRLTGAATVISTNKWATGRFVDQVCVVKNGTIVEMGSHNELIARGPQQSLYAAKWHAMTIQ